MEQINSSKTVLIIEDEIDLQQIISIYINKMGFKPICVNNGEEALKVLEKEYIDVILSDMIMPELTGAELLLILKRSHCQIPFVVLSACSDHELVVECMRLGAFDFVDKPFEADIFKKVIREAMRVKGEIDLLLGGKQLLKKKQPSPQKDEHTHRDVHLVKRMKFLSKGKKPVASQQQEIIGSKKQQKHQDKLSHIFVQEALNQLYLTEKAIRTLNVDEKTNWELGYINRVMNSIYVAAQVIQDKEIKTISKKLNDCFTMYRIRKSKLTDQELYVIKRAHKMLISKIKNFKENGYENNQEYSASDSINEIIAELDDCLSK